MNSAGQNVGHSGPVCSWCLKWGLSMGMSPYLKDQMLTQNRAKLLESGNTSHTHALNILSSTVLISEEEGGSPPFFCPKTFFSQWT